MFTVFVRKSKYFFFLNTKFIIAINVVKYVDTMKKNNHIIVLLIYKNNLYSF